ncbi:MAG: hypothetical protein F4Y88_06650 [Chloroflexi bacterium]|nr:hypothetical protein [Chloroflexota bacterium]
MGSADGVCLSSGFRRQGREEELRKCALSPAQPTPTPTRIPRENRFALDTGLRRYDGGVGRPRGLRLRFGCFGFGGCFFGDGGEGGFDFFGNGGYGG